MKNNRVVILWLVVPIALIFIWARLSAPPWPSRLPDVRLEPTRPILRDDQVTPDNAFYYIRQLTNFAGLPKLRTATNEYEQFNAMGWSKGSYTQLESIVTASSEALALYRKAADIPTCQLVTMNSFTCLVPYVNSVLEGSRELCFDAEWAAGRGDWRTAGDDYRAILQVSDHLGRGGALIDCLVGMAGKTMACGSLRRIAVQRSPRTSFLRDMSAMLLDLDSRAEPFAEAMRYERMAGQDAIRMIRDERELEAKTRLGRMLTKRKLARMLKNTPAHFDDVYSHIIAEASESYVAGCSFESMLPAVRVRNPVQQIGILMDDPIGRLMICILAPALDEVKERYFGTRCVLRGTALFLAVRAYQLEHHGRLPADLSELVPAYLDVLPEDPFGKNHEPFLFSVSGDAWTIYSVGPNQKDDKGIYDYWENREEKSAHKDQADVCFSSQQFAHYRDEYLKKKAKDHADTHQEPNHH